MNTHQDSHGKRLGEFIRTAREEAGISIRDMAERSGVPKGSLSKLENGLVEQPRPDSLDRIAQVLGTSLSELHAAAGYETSLPSLPVYLRSQYQHLGPDEQAELTRQVLAVTRQYGQPTATAGPAPGEDETD